MHERLTVARVAQIGAVALVAVAVVTTFQPWTVALDGDDILLGRSMWGSGATGACGALLLVLGCLLTASAGFRAGDRAILMTVSGAALVVAADALLLVVRYSAGRGTTVSFPSSDPLLDPHPSLVFDAPGPAVWVAVLGGGSVALAAVLGSYGRRLPPTSPDHRAVALAVVPPSIVGIIVFAVGSAALSWGLTSRTGEPPLWGSGALPVVGGLLVVVGAMAALVSVTAATSPARRPAFAAAATGSSTVGMALLVADRVVAAGHAAALTQLSSSPWSGDGFGENLVPLNAAPVLLGAGLVAVASIAATVLMPAWQRAAVTTGRPVAAR